MDHVFLIDGSGFIFRAFYGIKADMSRADGTPTNAVFGFTQMLLKMADDTDADYIAVVFDRARKSFRSDIYPEYKAHRPPPPDELIPQFDLVREATEAMNIAMVDMDGFEADDLIATYARQAVEAGANVTVVSSDKDLMQLVGPKVKMFDAMKNKEIGPDQVREKFGVGPDRVIDVQSLAGDSSDNVPGVQGIGVKTAAQLVEEYGDLDAILARAEEIKQPKRRQVLIDQADMARVSRELVTLRRDVPVEVPLESFKAREIDAEKLLAFLQQQEFKSLIARMESRFGIKAPEGEAAPKPAAPAASADDVDAPVAEEASAEAFTGETEYELVQDKVRLQAWIDEAASAGVFAVDTETTSLNAMRAELVGISLSIEPGKACYIPLAHTEPEQQSSLDLGLEDTAKPKGGIKQIKRDDALKLLKPLLQDPGVLKIGHNMKYDAKIFAHYGIEVAPIDDTMLLSYVLEGGLHAHNMDDLAALHLGHQTIKFKDVAGTGKAQVTFDKVPLETALDYAAEDADITQRLYRMLKPRLAREHMVAIYEVMERPLVGVLKQMESNGICVDAKMLKGLSADFANRLADLAVDIHQLAGREFNIASPKQLGEILFDEMGLEGAKKTKTGAYGTGAEVLETLAAEGHDLPARVLDWRQLAKLKSTYTDSLVEDINPATGRVHTNYGQAIASTGRLSSNDPNLQNIPVRTEEGRKIRQAFVAADGHVLLSADYSQIELRLLAHVAKIDVLIEAFKAGEDIHALTASQVFGVPIDGMDPMVRRQAKAINFGIIYGISAFGLARQLSIGRRGVGLYQSLFPALSGYPRLHGRDQTGRPRERLCDHIIWAQMSYAGHRQFQFGASQLCRARRHQRPHPGRRRRYHQARHDQTAGRPDQRRAKRGHAVAGA